MEDLDECLGGGDAVCEESESPFLRKILVRFAIRVSMLARYGPGPASPSPPAPLKLQLSLQINLPSIPQVGLVQDSGRILLE